MIDQRFLDDLAQDLKLPEEPQPEMQLASANTGVTTDGGAFVGYRMNMPKGLNTPQNQAKQSVLIADTMAGAGKGAVQGFVGLPGDLESIGRMALNYLGYNVDENTALPTSEEIGKRLESVLGPVIPPNQTTGVPTEERVRAAEGGELGGELAAPGGQLKLASKVAKPVIGATKEIIKAGKDLPVGMSIKGVDESLDPLGFYSAASKAVDNIAQEKGTGAQFLAQIEKTPGVKKEELLWTGLDDFLKGKKSVTKAEVQEYLNANRVEVKEVKLEEYPEGRVYSADGNAEDGYWVYDPDGSREVAGPFNDIFEAESQAERMTVKEMDAGPKFAKYTLPGGENYREVLLTLPSKEAPMPTGSIVKDGKDPEYPWAIMVDGKEVNRVDSLEFAEDTLQDEIRRVAGKSNQKSEFRSGHFDQPNILAHMRLNDRVDADGKKVLFVEEVQSDWHQAGRKQGYEPENALKQKQELKAIQTERFKLQEEKMKLEELADPYVAQGQDAPAEIVDKWSAVSNRINDLQSAEDRLGRSAKKGVPDAPFKTSWHELALKRAIQLASEGGYDRIAFTTGKTQAERYDLSKQVERITAIKDGNDFKIMGIDTKGNSFDLGKKSVDELPEIVGKDLADKIAKQETPNAAYAGKDLVVGGEGMKGFYDTILPKYLDKYGKKWDAKTGMTKIRLETDAQAAEDAKLLGELGVESNGKSAASVHYMDITPKMKESVLTKGQPLFQMAPAIPAGAAATQMQEENK